MTDEREAGFIVLHRRIESWPLWRSMTGAQRHVFVTMLLEANWKPSEVWLKEGRRVIERGQFITSQVALAKKAGSTRKVVRTTYAHLTQEGAITAIVGGTSVGHDAGHRVTITTIVNYSKYQDVSEGEGHGRATVGPRSGPIRTSRTSRTRKEDLSADADQQPILAVVEPSSPPRLRALTDSLVAAYAEVRGCPYAHGGARDAQALKRLLPLAVDAEILRRWRAGLASSGWASCSTFAQLGSKWNDLAAARPSGFVPAESHESFAARGGGTQEW